jgi:hypothetical protein
VLCHVAQQVRFVEVVKDRSDLIALALVSGVSLRTLYRIKSKAKPSELSRVAIARAFGFDPENLAFPVDVKESRS